MTNDNPSFDNRLKGFSGYGLVQLIHGNGKGKTTSAIGQAIRAVGAGKKVCIIAFDKGGNEHYSERKILMQINNIDFFVTGRDRIDADTGRFDFQITEEDKEEAERGLKIAKGVLCSSEYDLVILDEINSTVDLKMLSVSSVLDLIKEKNKTTELILTGRNPKKEMIEMAHLVSEVVMRKHYFYSGVPARKGLDF